MNPKHSEPILILGSGALATLFAARLSAAGVPVTVLGSWPEGLRALREGGAELEGAGSFPVRATAEPADCRGARLALVLVKSWQTERAARQLADCLEPDGVALTLQNGLGSAETLARTLGPGRAARGVTTLGATLLGPGRVRLGGEGSISLERRAGLAPLEADLRAAGFEVREAADIESLVWSKLVVNAAINPLTALLRVRNGELLERPTARELMGRLAREAAVVGRARGVRLEFDDPAQAAEQVARHTAANTSSMLQDVLRGAPTEIDAINGAVVRLGEEAGSQAPLNRAAWSLVKGLSTW
jgi:2-dehydropantoate 2-reductase